MPSGRLDTVVISMGLMKATFRICVPVSDAVERGLGEGVKKILGMKKGEHLKSYIICVWN